MASTIKVDTIQSTTANVFFQNSSGTEYARFDSSGNLGIGTTNPLTKLHVAGSSYISGNVGIGTSATPGTNNGLVSLNVGLKGENNLNLGFESNVLGYGGQLEFRRTARTGSTRYSQIGGLEDSSGNGMLSFMTAAAGADVSEHMRLDGSGNLKFNSGYGSVATAYGCRAWVNFNGTGTVAIRSSGNVSSITDNNVGNYTVNFTNAMPDANYAVTFGVGAGGSGLNASIVAGVLTSTQYGTASNKNTTALQFTTNDYTATLRDLGEIYVSIFR